MKREFRCAAGAGRVRRTVGYVILISASFATAACGSSSDSGLIGGPGGPGESAGGGSGGGLSSGCDPTVCPSNVSAGQIACCTSDLKCGMLIGKSPDNYCVTPDHGGAVDMSCPTAFVLDGAGTGCCRSNGTCGYEDTVYGTGCVDPAQIGYAPGQPCQ